MDEAPATPDMNPNPDTGTRPTASSEAAAASPAHTPSPGRAPRAPGAIVVRIPGPLRALTDGAGEVEVRGATVAGALEQLVADYPGLRRHLLVDGGSGVELRDHVNVFVNNDDVRTLDGMATSVAAEDTIIIVPSIAGG